jgi:PQQ-dependent dehydrogenase (s-GDH family)
MVLFFTKNKPFYFTMKNLLLLWFGGFCQILVAQTTPTFTMRTVRTGMLMPWEITYGPDNFLWTTEARGYKVSRVNPANGTTNVLLDLTNNKNFANFPPVSPQGGLMGLALHPQLLTGKPYVYLAYVYQFDGCQAGTDGCFFKTKVVRYTYNAGLQTLTDETILCDTIPGSSDHNGGRMTIGQINGTPYLFYGVGDMGAGQFGNASRVNHAQSTRFYEGKILRFNLEPDADLGVFDKWNPNDNPFGNAIWSYGHRNPQGLVFGNGKLYEAEHGPYSDDELNLIERGSNYGFPLIAGLADGNYNGAAVGFGTGVPMIVSEQNNAATIGSIYRDPLKAFFPESNVNIRGIYQNYVNNTIPVNNYFLSWNSIAPSGIDFYNSTAIPGWQNSILITSLKQRRVYRLQLNAAGVGVVSDTLPFFVDQGRFRDIAISPDGTKIYVSCDSEGQTSGPTAGTTIDPINKGSILEFTYNPTQSAGYCVAKSAAPWEDWLSNVQFNGINNTSGKFKNFASLGCSDFTNLSTNVGRGATYPLRVTASGSWAGRAATQYCRAWIDFNKNNLFEDNEKVLEGQGSAIYNSGVLIPATASIGVTRMRISLKSGAYPTPCETFGGGEVEDYNVNIEEGTLQTSNDISITMSAIPTTFRPYSTVNFKIVAKNNASTPFTNVKVKFPYPNQTVTGGTFSISQGIWRQWCPAATQCFEWIIPTLAANSTATLEVPLFVLNSTTPIVATATLADSTPIDVTVANNVASFTVNWGVPQQTPLVKVAPTQQIPIVVQQIMPNPTENVVIVELESLIDKDIVFDFYDFTGKKVRTEFLQVQKGLNRFPFDFEGEAPGVYFIQTNQGTGRNVPLKFVKL